MTSKLNWTQDEEDLLRQLKKQQIENKWSVIAKELNLRFPNKMRTGKQCRERYVNYIQHSSTGNSISQWSGQEIDELFRLFRKVGAKWTAISKNLKGKSQNCVKNMFYGTLRKALRKINCVAKEKVNKYMKPIKFQSLVKVINSSGKEEWGPTVVEFCEKLKLELLFLMENINEEFMVDQVASIVKNIHNFNVETRSYSMRLGKNKSNHIKEKQDRDRLKNESRPPSRRSLLSKVRNNEVIGEQETSKVTKENLTRRQENQSLYNHEEVDKLEMPNEQSLLVKLQGQDLNEEYFKIINKKYVPDGLEFIE